MDLYGLIDKVGHKCTSKFVVIAEFFGGYNHDIPISKDLVSSKGWSTLLVCSLVVEGVVITKEKYMM